jgi:hypothetical protein
MNILTRTTQAHGSILAMLFVAGALSLAVPADATPNDSRSGSSATEDDDRVEVGAPDEELVGTLPIFFDPDSGMPMPEEPEEPEAEPDDEPDDPEPPAGGGGLLGPDLPAVQGAPRLFLYGPYHLLALHREAFDTNQTGVMHTDLSNPNNAYLVFEGSTSFIVPEDLFTLSGIETGLLIGDDELDPVLGCVSYLGQMSRPTLLDRASKKDFPVAALAEYGFLLDGVSLFTRSTLHGRSLMNVKSSGNQVQVTLQQF